MKQLMQISIVLLVIVAVIGVIYLGANKPKTPTQIDNNEEKVESIFYSYSGTMIGDIYSYKVYQKGSKEVLEVFYTGINKDKPVKTNVEAGTLDKVLDIIKKYDVYNWNGFDKVNSDILDGYSLALTIEFTNGKKIEVSGSNAAPSGFYDFEKEFEEVLKEPLEKLKKKLKVY